VTLPQYRRINSQPKSTYLFLMNFFQFIFQDWKVNTGNTKGRLILLLFRISNFSTTDRFYYYLFFPYRIVYKIIVQGFFVIEIPWNVHIGKNLRLFHGQALVIHNRVMMGENCTLRHCTTIGNKEFRDGSSSTSPVIGNNVDVGSNVCIVGGIVIGDNVKIGCGAVVTRSISGDCIAVGNPAIEKRKMGGLVDPIK